MISVYIVRILHQVYLSPHGISMDQDLGQMVGILAISSQSSFITKISFGEGEDESDGNTIGSIWIIVIIVCIFLRTFAKLIT